MEELSNKTIMCSVLFLDIVEYSKKPVSGQITLKNAFNTMLSNAIRDVPVHDRVILDTGDGAAISFLGDVEDALKAALTLRDSLLDEGARMDPPLLVRIGINIGPVRLVKDINDRPNIVGDGINVAQRVMGFAAPGQILVSRSYFDAVSRISAEYADMFHSEGSRTDKHVREHAVYAIGHPDEIAAQQKAGGKSGGAAHPRDAQHAGAIQDMHAAFQRSSLQQRALYVLGFIGALALLIVLVIKIAYRPIEPVPEVVVETPAKPTIEPPAAPEVVAEPPPAVEAPIEPSTAEIAPEPIPPQPTETVTDKKPRVAARPAPAGQAKSATPPPSAHPLQETTAQEPPVVKPGATATLDFAVTPWGEVYLDGKMQGVTPPLNELRVTPGEHEIEIRNTTFAPYTLSIQVKADEKMKIRHKFVN